MTEEIELPPITHEAEAEGIEMTPEQSAAYREYMEKRPDDPAERERLRRIFTGRAEGK